MKEPLVHLAPLSANDCETARGWRNNAPETLRTPFKLTAEMQADFYRNVVCNRYSVHRYYGVHRDGLGFIGMGGLTNIAWEAGSAEISLILAPSHRQHGLGRPSVEALLDEAFGVMRLAQVYGEVYESNPKAHGFWSKLAAERGARTAVLPARTFWAGRHWDSLYFSFVSPMALMPVAAYAPDPNH